MKPMNKPKKVLEQKKFQEKADKFKLKQEKARKPEKKDMAGQKYKLFQAKADQRAAELQIAAMREKAKKK